MKHLLVVGCALSLSGAFIACAPPKQAGAPPKIEDPGDQDMQAEEEREIEPAVKMPDEMTVDEKKSSCCAQCDKGMAGDRTGQPPDQIPCADFTSVLEEFCLDYFRKHPMKASECKSSGAPEPGGEEPAAAEPGPGT